MVNPVPDGYEAVTPYLIVDGAARAIDFYVQAFGAVELLRMAAPGDRVGHAELRLGRGVVMLADPLPEMGALSPEPGRPVPVSFVFYCADVDAVAARAVALGAVLKGPIEDKFYGDRMATLVDPFGHCWHVSTHVEDVPPDELARRARAAGGA